MATEITKNSHDYRDCYVLQLSLIQNSIKPHLYKVVAFNLVSHFDRLSRSAPVYSKCKTILSFLRVKIACLFSVEPSLAPLMTTGCFIKGFNVWTD